MAWLKRGYSSCGLCVYACVWTRFTAAGGCSTRRERKKKERKNRGILNWNLGSLVGLYNDGQKVWFFIIGHYAIIRTYGRGISLSGYYSTVQPCLDVAASREPAQGSLLTILALWQCCVLFARRRRGCCCCCCCWSQATAAAAFRS